MALQLTRGSLAVAVAVFLLALVSVPCECANGDKLVFLQAVSGTRQQCCIALNDSLQVWRHGDRSPAGTFRTDKWQNDAWPQGWGQLTTVSGTLKYYLLKFE